MEDLDDASQEEGAEEAEETKSSAPPTVSQKTSIVSVGDGKKLVGAPKTRWIETLIYLDGKRFSFKGRDYLFPIYNNFYPRRLLKFSRQSEKSTLLANEMIVNCAVTAHTKAIYIAPSHAQVRQFSSGKLKPWTQDSPIIQKYFHNSFVSDQVFEKGFTNGSMMFLRSAFLNADRVRGLSGTELFMDEMQNILTSNIPVILEVLSHAPNPQVVYSGTPLTLDNPIEAMWSQSSQNEWLVPCDRHSPLHWNFLDEKCMGKEGPICNKCGGRINPAQGKWFQFSSKTDIAGFHISQMMVPWMMSPVKWKELLFKYETYSKGQFYQECLGISYDSANKPVSRQELIACCSSHHPLRTAPDAFTDSMKVFAGVDWGEGSDGSERGMKGRLKNASYTVLTLGGYVTPKVFHVFFMKRYEGEEALPSNCIKDIIRILRMFNFTSAGVDWGHGWGVNDQLEQVFDKPGAKKIIKFQYVGMQRERKKYDPIGIKLQLNRTEVMSDFFADLKGQKYLFPPWESMKGFLCDIEHIHSEFGYAGMLKYDHRASEPDDAAHSIILCREAADVYYGK